MWFWTSVPCQLYFSSPEKKSSVSDLFFALDFLTLFSGVEGDKHICNGTPKRLRPRGISSYRREISTNRCIYSIQVDPNADSLSSLSPVLFLPPPPFTPAPLKLPVFVGSLMFLCTALRQAADNLTVKILCRVMIDRRRSTLRFAITENLEYYKFV